MQELMFILLMVGILGLIFGGFFISKKFNLKEDDYSFVILVLNLVNYVSSKFEWKYKVGMVTVMEAVVDALEFVSSTYDLDQSEYDIIADLVFKETLTICQKYELETDPEFIKMLKFTVDFLLTDYKQEKEEEKKTLSN
jgi:hypothetical protein